jgi:hypothetical protein
MKIISALGYSTQQNSFKIDGTIRIFHDKQKLKYMTTKLPLWEILQGILHRDEIKQNHKRMGSTKP